MNEEEIKLCMGAFNEAEKMSRDLLELERRVIGADSPEAAETTYSLATVKAKQGKKDEALALLRQAVDHGMLPREAANLGEDADLQALQGDPRFNELVAHAKAVAAQKAPTQNTH